MSDQETHRQLAAGIGQELEYNVSRRGFQYPEKIHWYFMKSSWIGTDAMS